MKKFILGLVVVSMLMFVGCGSNEDFVEKSDLNAVLSQNEALSQRITLLEDTNAVEKVVNNLFIQTDNMDWDALVNDVFTETVYFDMTSVGGSAGDVTSQSIVEGWEQGFSSIESVHHQSGNLQIEVDGDRATVFQYGTATQYQTTESGNNTRTFIGTYQVGLIKADDMWKVDAFSFNLKIMDGNTSFE
ncbi:nuclear transport factor 2 family protein [Acidaminobacter sp. JC074]|uniref:nuclear transport factor 2 family protein n=1 Tax=Acidaminobacter sp. JC074 TaxID=2530199 RepID=UPI001F11416F|nr:nuclear transport factor 2 family protein [Acidaminobacter sp. JC074]MCH4886903.1 nuclear transport factor 2 family protein [Acidaminobacter sp. JC074]